MKTRLALSFAVALASSAGLAAAFNPSEGDWGKSDPAHLRVMTWNVEDGVCSTATKTEGVNSWTAIARIIAAMKPDVLILQETGDNAGNSDVSGGSADSVSTLETVFDRFFRGGDDPWRGGTVTAFVQAYDPAYDLPFIRVSAASDNFNRNVILSRFPFADINGDGVVALDNFFNIADGYAPGGGGGIRGFAYAEIDLPDDVYAGDLVIGNSHLKAGGSSSDRDDRLRAAQNIVYFIDHYFNGAGAGFSDPNNAIFSPGSNDGLLGENDIVVWGGDWNEDEATNGRRGPAEWMTRAAINGGTDGPDADRSDAVYDNAVEPFTGETDTRGGSKLDYLAWFDSVGTAVNQVVLYANPIPTGAFPPEMASFSFPTFLTSLAADHNPVFVDLALPEPTVAPCPADLDGSGAVSASDLAILIAAWGGVGPADLDGSGVVNASDLAALIAAWGPCPE